MSDTVLSSMQKWLYGLILSQAILPASVLVVNVIKPKLGGQYCSLTHVKPRFIARQEPIPAAATYRAGFKNRETAMKIAKIILAAIACVIFISSAASAQQARTGTITKIDRIHGTVAIQQIQSGTVGANTGGASEEFKAQDGLSLDTLHAGDKVTYSVTETGGSKALTKLQKQ
jgi:Cu/Ag efflux protein CusF